MGEQMKNHVPMKPRPAGSVHDAIVNAFAELEGGVSKAAELLELSRPHVTAMGDPDREGRHRVNLSLQQAGRLSEGGATALAEWLAIKAGGVFVPNCDATCAAAIQDAIASYSRESGEAISAAIMAGLDTASKANAVREIDEAIAALAALRAHVTAPSNVTPMKGAA